MPQRPARFQRVIEIVPTASELRDAGRRRYQQYREAGHELSTHNL
jgi:DNA polymerase IIIc chi subunit